MDNFSHRLGGIRRFLNRVAFLPKFGNLAQNTTFGTHTTLRTTFLIVWEVFEDFLTERRFCHNSEIWPKIPLLALAQG